MTIHHSNQQKGKRIVAGAAMIYQRANSGDPGFGPTAVLKSFCPRYRRCILTNTRVRNQI